MPAGAEVIDAAGKTIIPGLIDLHSHYNGERAAAERQLKAQLYFGVLPGGASVAIHPRRCPSCSRPMPVGPDLPRTYTAGFGFSTPGGFGNSANQPETPEEARELVRGLASQGVHFTKMWITEMAEPGHIIPPEIRTAIVEESIANGLISRGPYRRRVPRPTADRGRCKRLPAHYRADFRSGRRAPVDNPRPSDEFIQMCLDNEVSFTPTLSIMHNNWHFAEHPELLDDPDLRAVLNPAALARVGRPRDPGAGGRRRELRGPQGGIPPDAGFCEDDA